MEAGTVTTVLGSQWGDEGKGKLVDILAQEADLCARCQGGNNAGHTIVIEGKMYDFHLVPSGLINPKCIALIGNGVVVHIPGLLKELQALKDKGIDWEGRVLLSDRAHLVFDFHQIIDGLREEELGRGSIGTTKKGIGPTYSAKASRSGLRVHHIFDQELFEEKLRQAVANKMRRYGTFEYDVEKEIATYKEYAKILKPMVVESVSYIHKAIQQGKRVLVEGANAIMLDIDFGTYPYVTSSNTTVGGVCTGLGIPPSFIKNTLGVVKAYTTRVGGGPFPTEQLNEVGELLQRIGAEVGVTTGRKRRCGWLDLVVLKYSHMINNYSALNLTKLDVLDTLPEIKVAVAYRHQGEPLDSFPADLKVLGECEVVYQTLPGWQTKISNIRDFASLPENAKNYIRFIEDFLHVPVRWVGVGAGRDAMVAVPLRS